MKKRICLFAIGLFLLLMPTAVFASNARIDVNASSTAILGNNISVTVKLSSSSSIGSWQVDLGYDKNMLKLVSSGAENGGSYMANTIANGTKSKSYTFTFKTLAKGTTTISAKSFLLYDYDTMQPMTTSTSSATVNIKTKEEIEASYSDNANLKSIEVVNYSLSPDFNKNTKEYSVEVENDVTSVTINATKEDSKASVKGTGTFDLVEGNNKYEIIVTAQKGNTSTYVVNVYRKELDPIKVNFNNKEYSVVRKSDELKELDSFNPTTINYEGTDVPALESEVTKIKLLGLKDDSGNIIMVIYDSNKLVKEYIELSGILVKVVPEELKESDEFKYYIKNKVKINGYEINGYLLNNDSKEIIFYGLDILTGKKNYYRYNKADESIQLYDNELGANLNEKLQNYKYVIYGLIGLCAFLLLIAIFKRPAMSEEEKKRRKELKKRALEEKEASEANEEKFVDDEDSEESYVEDMPLPPEDDEEVVEEESEQIDEEPVEEETSDEDEEEIEEEVKETPKSKKELKKEKAEAKKKKKEEKKKAKEAEEFDW